MAMPVSFSWEPAEQRLTLRIGSIVFRGGRPVVNGLLLPDPRIETVGQSDSGITLQPSAPGLRGGTFGLTVLPVAGLAAGASDPALQIRYWLEDLPEDFVLDSFGIRFDVIENMRLYLPMGYNCWDGATYQEPEAMPHGDADRAEQGYAVTQVIPRFGSGSVILGFDRHDRFQQTFTYETRQRPVASPSRLSGIARHVPVRAASRSAWSPSPIPASRKPCAPGQDL